MKIFVALLLVLLACGLSACAPLLIGGVVGYEIGHHHHSQRMPMGVHR